MKFDRKLLSDIASARKVLEAYEAYLLLLEELVEQVPSDPLPAPRNPMHPLAATMDDIVPGAELIAVGYDKFPDMQEFKVEESYVGEFGDQRVKSTQGETIYLGDRGIVPYSTNPVRGNTWNKCYVTFLNTAENRRMIVEWLLSRGSVGAQESAEMLVERHQEDYSAQFVVKHGRIVARVV